MSLIIGLVGKPSSGKSTFFNSCTLSNVDMAQYPFTTINKNEAVAYVTAQCPCAQLNIKCNPHNSDCKNGTRLIPVNIIDVAGLVPDAHEGKGMGNKFMDDLRNADSLIQVIDCSGKTNEKGEPTENYDITNEIRFLEKEINLWYHRIITKNLEKVIRKSMLEKKDLLKSIVEDLSGLKINEMHIQQALEKNDLDLNSANKWSETEKELFAFTLREISKPMIYAANKFDTENSKDNLEKLTDEFPKKTIIPTSAEYERALRNATKKELVNYIPGNSSFDITKKDELNEQQLKAIGKITDYLKENKSTGIQECLNKVMFTILDQIVVYPVQNENKYSDGSGNILPDAILMPRGSNAKDLAFKIHTDIGNTFLYAVDAKTKMRIKAEHEIKDGDIIKIVSTAR